MPTWPLTARRNFRHVGCRTSVLSDAEFATPPLDAGKLRWPSGGDFYESVLGSPRGRAETVCIFCNKVLHLPDIPKRASSEIPRIASPFVVLVLFPPRCRKAAGGLARCWPSVRAAWCDGTPQRRAPTVGHTRQRACEPRLPDRRQSPRIAKIREAFRGGPSHA